MDRRTVGPHGLGHHLARALHEDEPAETGSQLNVTLLCAAHEDGAVPKYDAAAIAAGSDAFTEIEGGGHAFEAGSAKGHSYATAEADSIAVLKQGMFDSFAGQLDAFGGDDEVVFAGADEFGVTVGQVADEFEIGMPRAGASDGDAIASKKEEAADAVDSEDDATGQDAA